MTPAIATAGETLTLEGTFASDVMVQFPGGVVQSAMTLGEHRATVVVPEATTAGDLTVTTGGVPIGPLPFRRTSFALGLQPFRVSYEQTDGARGSPTLRIARSAATSAVIKGWLYVVGGNNGSGPVNSIERALTGTDGTVGSFDIVGDVSLVDARSGHTSAVIGNMLFVIAGSGTSGALNSVEHATINTDGTLGRFASDSTTALVTPRSGHTSVVIGDYLYVIGGTRNDGSKLASVERAIILSDGSLGAFATVDVALMTARSSHTTAIIGNALYVIGGETAGELPSGSVERAAINADGSLGAFSRAQGVTLAAPRSGHCTTVLGRALYVLGGSTGGSATSGTERAPIGSDGSVGTFASLSSIALSTARADHTSAIVGNWVYAIGGHGSGNLIETIDRANLDADSALGTFAELGNSIVLSRVHSTSTIIRNSIYVIGQSGGENTIERATLLPDGSITTFTTVGGISPVTSRSSHTTVLIGNFLYVIGGSDSAVLSSIERAVVNPDGSFGPFTPILATLNEARSGHISVILGKFLYVISGIGINHTRLTSIERALINEDSTLSAFTTVSGVALHTGRNYSTAITTDQYLYIIGGFDDATGGTSSVERAAIGPDGSLGQFAVVAPLINARGAHTNSVVGNALYVVGGVTPGGHVTSVERAIVNPDGSLGAFGIVSSLVENRARHTVISAGDSFYVVGGVTQLPSGDIAEAFRLGHADLP